MSDLEARIADAVRDGDIPGAAIAYLAGGEITEAAAGVLNRDTGLAVTTDSLFQIGSVTKLWTATLAHQLVDEGLLDLDTPVRAYLPDLRLADEDAAAALTPRDLLRHTTGFAGDVFDDLGRGDDAVGRLVAALAGATSIAGRGELFSYCNSGYVVLGHLIATLRGMPWEAALRKHLIEPLGLGPVALFAEEAILRRTAAGHLIREGGQEVTPVWQLPRSLAPAGSSLCTTPRVLLEFARLFLEGGRPGILSPAAAGRGWERQVPVPGVAGRGVQHWGLGWMLFDWGGTMAAGHDGNTPGQTAFFRVVPEAGFAIAAVVNGGNAFRVFDGLLLPLISELTGIEIPAGVAPPADPRPVSPEPYAGEYVDTLVTHHVTPEGGGLLVTTVPGETAQAFGMTGTSARYVHLAGNTFVQAEAVDGKYSTATFVMPDGGPASHMHSGLRAVPRAR
ncbi:serine hydrolase domain-containing protein [Longispora albida]|uniref:serine hydrolase domain-containing protein n=1 Tax=Longispora albida TaxID=203523 RepID=UPI00037039AF|nr:serine hydrolase domain-containing protein [Longispora albida]